VRFSIVTALYNRLDLTSAFWASLLVNSPNMPWEVILIDDGSTDGTRDWLNELNAFSCELGAVRLESQSLVDSVSGNRVSLIAHCQNPPQRIHVVLNDKNLGYAANNNLGAKAAQGDVLVFLNNDLVLTEGWWAPLYNKLSTNLSGGIVGNVQVQPETGLIDHAGVYFDLVGCPGHRLKDQPLSALRGGGVYAPAVTAACWLVRKEVFLSVGGFDERYRNGAEDVDLCLRLGQQGFLHWVDYRSVIYHHVSSSPGRKKHDLINQARFLRKWSGQTSRYGQIDWPREYLRRIIKTPSQLNFVKFMDALLRFFKLRTGDSAWAVRRREKLIAMGQAEERKLFGL
jgi:GT2 family glycosyltransferase